MIDETTILNVSTGQLKTFYLQGVTFSTGQLKTFYLQGVTFSARQLKTFYLQGVTFSKQVIHLRPILRGKTWLSYLYVGLLRDNLADCSVFNAAIMYHVLNVYSTVYASYES